MISKSSSPGTEELGDCTENQRENEVEWKRTGEFMG